MSSRGYVSATGNGHNQPDQMSQPASPLLSSFPTPYASSIDSQQSFSEPQRYFERPDLLYFSDDGSGPSSSHGFGSGPPSEYTSSQHSTISTPEFAPYNFDESRFSYSSPPTSDALGPYFVNQPSVYPVSASTHFHPTRHSYVEPAQQSQGRETSAPNLSSHGGHCEGRRRSLSHSDVDAIANASSTTNIRNPTFIRLQAPRSKPMFAEDRRKSRSRPKHTRSASHGSSVKGKEPVLSSPALQFGLLPTSIGTPLDPDEKWRGVFDVNAMALRAARSRNPTFEHMTSDADLARSRQIIQIGALMVQDAQRPQSTVEPSLIDPSLVSQLAAVDQYTTLLEKFSDVERHFEGIRSTPEVLEACMTIRKALECDDSDGRDGLSELDATEAAHSSDVPSHALSSEDEDMIARHLEGSDLMAMLRNDERRN